MINNKKTVFILLLLFLHSIKSSSLKTKLFYAGTTAFSIYITNKAIQRSFPHVHEYFSQTGLSGLTQKGYEKYKKQYIQKKLTKNYESENSIRTFYDSMYKINTINQSTAHTFFILDKAKLAFLQSNSNNMIYYDEIIDHIQDPTKTKNSIIEKSKQIAFECSFLKRLSFIKNISSWKNNTESKLKDFEQSLQKTIKEYKASFQDYRNLRAEKKNSISLLQYKDIIQKYMVKRNYKKIQSESLETASDHIKNFEELLKKHTHSNEVIIPLIISMYENKFSQLELSCLIEIIDKIVKNNFSALIKEKIKNIKNNILQTIKSKIKTLRRFEFNCPAKFSHYDNDFLESPFLAYDLKNNIPEAISYIIDIEELIENNYALLVENKILDELKEFDDKEYDGYVINTFNNESYEKISSCNKSKLNEQRKIYEEFLDKKNSSLDYTNLDSYIEKQNNFFLYLDENKKKIEKALCYLPQEYQFSKKELDDTSFILPLKNEKNVSSCCVFFPEILFETDINCSLYEGYLPHDLEKAIKEVHNDIKNFEGIQLKRKLTYQNFDDYESYYIHTIHYEHQALSEIAKKIRLILKMYKEIPTRPYEEYKACKKRLLHKEEFLTTIDPLDLGYSNFKLEQDSFYFEKSSKAQAFNVLNKNKILSCSEKKLKLLYFFTFYDKQKQIEYVIKSRLCTLLTHPFLSLFFLKESSDVATILSSLIDNVKKKGKNRYLHHGYKKTISLLETLQKTFNTFSIKESPSLDFIDENISIMQNALYNIINDTSCVTCILGTAFYTICQTIDQDFIGKIYKKWNIERNIIQNNMYSFLENFLPSIPVHQKNDFFSYIENFIKNSLPDIFDEMIAKTLESCIPPSKNNDGTQEIISHTHFSFLNFFHSFPTQLRSASKTENQLNNLLLNKEKAHNEFTFINVKNSNSTKTSFLTSELTCVKPDYIKEASIIMAFLGSQMSTAYWKKFFLFNFNAFLANLSRNNITFSYEDLFKKILFHINYPERTFFSSHNFFNNSSYDNLEVQNKDLEIVRTLSRNKQFMQFCNWILKHTSFFYDSESKVKKENISTKKIKSLNFIEYFANNSNDIEKALNDSYNILSKGEILKEKIYFLFVLASLCELCNIDFKKHLNNKDELFFTLMPLFIIKDKTSYYRDLCKDIFLLFPHALTIIGTLSKDSIIETINSLYTTTNTDAVCSMIEKNPEIILYPFINIIEILENIKPANLNWISNPLDKKNSNTSYLELLWKLLDNRKKCQSEEIRILYIKELLVPFIQDIIKHETSFQTNNSNIIENYITKTQNHVYKKIEAFHNNSSDKGKKKILAEQRIKPFYSLKRLRELLKKRIMAKGPTKKILWNFLHTKLKKKSSLQEIAVQFKFFSKLQKVLIKLPKHFIWYRENQMEQLKNFTLKTVCCTKNSRFHNCENNFMNIDKLSLLFQKNGSSIFFKSPKNKIRFLMVGNREDLVQLILMRHAARFPLLQDIRSKIQIPLAWKQYEEEYFTREKNNR